MKPLISICIWLACTSPLAAQFFPTTEVSASPALPIDDLTSPISSTVLVVDSIVVADLQIGVDLTHTWIGDLEVELTSPAGTSSLLHFHQGDSARNLALTWWQFGAPNGSVSYSCGCEMQPAPGSLFDFFGENAQGAWTISVADTASGDEGVFNSWNLSIAETGPPLPIEDLFCQPIIDTGVVSASWTNPAVYDEIIVTINGVDVAALPGTATSYTSPSFTPGAAEKICLTGVVGPWVTLPTCCDPFIPGPATEIAYVFAGESPSTIDSVAELQSSLLAAGLTVEVVAELNASTMETPGSLWLCLGTFPNAYQLSACEGAFVRDLVAAGVPLYVEGADTWGFHEPTPLSEVDGVADFGVIDGDDTLLGVVGADFAGFTFSDLAAVYVQDQPFASDWTDQLLPATDDQGGPNAGVIWSDDLSGGSTGYDVGILYDSAPGFGRVIAQSWEFGGFQGDRDELVTRYLEVLLAPAAGTLFRRGDANADGAFNIADAITILARLFFGDPVDCLDTVDVNDDSAADIADAIYTLSALFEFGAPPPPSPGPVVCGLDPTDDPLDCARYAPCN